MKVRVLKFDDSHESKTHFVMLYHGFVTGGSITSQGKNMETTRREARILDKFESVGIAPDVDNPDKVVYAEGNRELVLDQPEYDLLKRYFETTPWSVRASRTVVNTFDWLLSLQPEDRNA